ncbi:MAG: ATP-binding protein [Ferruginibacter sp.]
MIKKIVILGPESTGKTTLCTQLAEHYKTLWVKEYAREFLITNGTHYTFDNLLEIAQGQLALEDVAMLQLETSLVSGKASSKVLIIDTNMYVLKVWCEFVFGKAHQWILDKIVERKYDLYLLCDIDLPWIKDELREYPDLQTRQKLYHIYKNLLVNQTVPWVTVNGNYEERLKKAIEAVNEILY